ncbi:TetR/AcrR family transcriptional regulator [Sphingobium estronivorans]|uniref:TetR/AcrR family transcriptional regulator n=1 Tax=Sphingobium estronivorans TaxID=1577690 RepID=UPI0013C31652|nr:TetR/AcrR family transcriptional regulator [Sphingobium estronivorans]
MNKPSIGASPIFREGDRRGDPAANPQSRRSRGRPSRAQSELRNRELLNRALDLFLERGFEGTTIEAIVDSLGMARKTVYTRYGDKLTLFRAALQGAINDLVIPAERLQQIEKPDLHETLVAIAGLILSSMRSTSGRRLIKLAHSELYQMPEIWSYFLGQTVQVTLGHLTELFEQHKIGQPAEVALSCYLLIIHGSYQAQSWFEMTEEEFQRQLRNRVSLFLYGALPR